MVMVVTGQPCDAATASTKACPIDPRLTATVRPFRSATERMAESLPTMIAVPAPLVRMGEMMRARSPAASAKVAGASPAIARLTASAFSASSKGADAANWFHSSR